MTVKLYDEDCYTKKFQATVVDCQPEKEYYKVVLSRTAFFPEGGGQSADTGSLTYHQVATVRDVREKQGVIYHIVDRDIAAGTVVEGEIDWEERFSKMQQHTGEHIVSGIIYRTLGHRNVGFHLGDEIVTMDFDGVITRAQADAIEAAANKAVFANLPVEIQYPSKEELEDIEYRSKIEIEGQVRIVNIPGYDTCACCAPHVAYTGEVGLIKLTDIQSHRGGVRINLTCGTRALRDYQVKSYNTKGISGLLSAKEDEILDAVVRMKEELLSAKQFAVQLQKELVEYKVQNIDKDAKQVILFEEDLEMESMRELVNRIVTMGIPLVAVFKGSDISGYNYIIGSVMQDVRLIGKALNKSCNGRGGGKPMMVQGSLQATMDEINNADVWKG